MITPKFTELVIALIAASALTTLPAQSQSTFKLSSTVFQPNSSIPTRYSAYGENISPSLTWTGAPAEAQSFALILDDPDAGSQPFVHWVMYNIPRTAMSLPEGIKAAVNVATPPGAVQGLNGRRQSGYFGPRPPAGGIHHYNFHLYALRSEPNLAPGLNKNDLLTAIRPHVIAETVLVGTYTYQP